MSYYELDARIAARAEPSERAAFIYRTYAHLAGAVLAFVLLEAALFTLAPRLELDRFFAAAVRSPVTLLILLLAFVVVGHVARYWAHASTSPAMQYLGLGLYVLFEAIFFVPILYIARYHVLDQDLIAKAGIMTLSLFGGLTMVVLISRKDFSFLRSILSIALFLVIGIVVIACVFPLNLLGLGFSFLMVALAAGFILYHTSNVLHHYSTDRHVGAALELFAALAFLFWEILWIMIQLSNNRN
jgi:uncharacterized protein